MPKLTAHTITTLIRGSVPSAEQGQFTVLNVNAKSAECVLIYDDSQLRFGGTLSGPTMMTLADAAMYAAVLAYYGEQLLAVTQDFSIHFLSKPAATDLHATATILKAGKRSAVLTVHLYSQQQLVAHASGTYALPRGA